MYNQQIHLFYTNLINTQFQNINKIKEEIEHITNSLMCLKGFFETNESEQSIIKMPLNYTQGEQPMKFKGKTILKNKTCNTWYTRYRIDGKQYYISGKTQQEVLKELKSKLNYQTKEKKKYTTLLDWYKQWLELFKINKVKETTLMDYKSTLTHIPNTLLNKNIREITSLEIQSLLNSIQKERTKQKVYELLKALFDKAEKHNITKNILTIIEKPTHKKINGIAFTNQDKELFINYCMKNKNYIYLIALYQGLRKGEVLALTFNDIDYKNNTLNINKSLNIKNKIDTTKNATSTRIMPLFKPTLEILNKIKIDNADTIFKTKQKSMQDEFRKIITTLNLNPKYTIHSLRHTFITFCQDNQIPEHIIQNWVGHQIGSNVTKQVYTHIENDTNNLFINKLNNTKFYSNSTHK